MKEHSLGECSCFINLYMQSSLFSRFEASVYRFKPLLAFGNFTARLEHRGNNAVLELCVLDLIGVLVVYLNITNSGAVANDIRAA